jgi:uncharacterized membrane protein YkoI
MAAASQEIIHSLFKAAPLCHSATDKSVKTMALRIPLLLAAAAALLVSQAPAAVPVQSREQDAALRALQQGRIMPLRAIENRIVPKMRGFDYLGPEFEPGAARYRLKFIRDGRVVWIDVDARTGHVLAHSGH